jgi:hypothetical protein
MSLPSENRPQSFGRVEEGGEGLIREDLAVLDSAIYRDMRWCAHCGGQAIFVEVYEFSGGRVGVCLGCGEEKIALFTRTTEAA